MLLKIHLRALACSTQNCEQERMKKEDKSPNIYRQDHVESQYNQISCHKKVSSKAVVLENF